MDVRELCLEMLKNRLTAIIDYGRLGHWYKEHPTNTCSFEIYLKNTIIFSPSTLFTFIYSIIVILVWLIKKKL